MNDRISNLRTMSSGVLILSGFIALAPGTASASMDRDVTRAEVARFDEFLAHHPETAHDLYQHPKLIRNEEWIERHPNLRRFLWEHPGVREELLEDPKGFMRRERNFAKHEWHDGDDWRNSSESWR